MLRMLRIGLGVLILAVSIPFLVWGFWPAHRETRLRTISASAGSDLPKKGSLTLTFPPQIRTGESSIVRLLLDLEGSGNPSYYDTHQVIAEARFDLPGMSVRPFELISAPISAGQTAVFYWTLRPQEAGRYPGTIWVYLRSVDKLTGQESRETVSAQLVELESVNFLGLPVNRARLTGLVGVGLGLILCLPLLGILAKKIPENQVESHKIG